MNNKQANNREIKIKRVIANKIINNILKKKVVNCHSLIIIILLLKILIR